MVVARNHRYLKTERIQSWAQLNGMLVQFSCTLISGRGGHPLINIQHYHWLVVSTPFSFPAAVPCWHSVSVHGSVGVQLAVQFSEPVIIGLDDCVVHELLHCVHLKFFGELLVYIWVFHTQGKIVHGLSDDLVHEGWIDLGF